MDRVFFCILREWLFDEHFPADIETFDSFSQCCPGDSQNLSCFDLVSLGFRECLDYQFSFNSWQYFEAGFLHRPLEQNFTDVAEGRDG